MKRTVLGLTSALVLSMGISPGDAHAKHSTYYGDSSRTVAKHIGCKKFYYPKSSSSGEGAYNLDSGVCWLKGRRVNVITFKSKRQQRDWNAAAKVALPSNHYWANGQGALVTAKNGNRPAAKVGAKKLPGEVVHPY